MQHAISTRRTADVIGMIYDAALYPACWEGALAAMVADARLACAALSLATMPDHASILNVTSGMAEPFAEAMPAMLPHLAALWGGTEVLRGVPLDQPVVLSRVAGVPRDDEPNPAWRDWMRPQGLDDVVALTIARDPHAVGAVSMGRHRDAPPIDDGTLAALSIYIPHLQRAATIGRMLDLAALRTSTFAALFDTLAVPVLLVDRELAIAHANIAAREVLARDAALRSRRGVLAVRNRAAEAALTAAVRRAADDPAGIGRMGMSIPLFSDDHAAQALHVLPLHRVSGPGSAGDDATVAVFVAGRQSVPAVVGGAMEALFGLTPAEARVFESIAAGHTVAETARALAVEGSTVRSHLLRVFDKTGTRRQAELVRIAAQLRSPAAPTIDVVDVV